MRLHSLPADTVPWLNKQDLLVDKMSACGQRAVVAESKLDAADAVTLIRGLTRNGNVMLNNAQRAMMADEFINLIGDVSFHSGKPREWWMERLGL